VTYWIAGLILAGIGIALFVLPHHKSDYEFGSLARDFEEIVTGGFGETPGIVLLQGLVGIGCLAVFMPAILAIALAFTSPAASQKVMILGGILLVIGAGLTCVVEIVSNMLIGWGSGSKYPDTGIAFLAPLFPLLCGLASIVMGAMRVRLP
jgi:hypothetical protein